MPSMAAGELRATVWSQPTPWGFVDHRSISDAKDALSWWAMPTRIRAEGVALHLVGQLNSLRDALGGHQGAEIVNFDGDVWVATTETG